MDRTMQTPLGGKSPYSPRPRQNISMNRSVASPVYRKSLRLNTSNRSMQSVQVVMKTPHNYVERFGQSLPVLVTEALTFVERNAVVTARISDAGYAWLICGRRLLIWQYQPLNFSLNTPQKRQITQCYELQLPQSDLAHRAELVSVFTTKTSGIPSCIAVSPEGVVRYWPAIAHESVSVEQSVDLQGQECDSLTDVKGLGCILATTTCTVVLVQPQFTAGKHLLTCRTLRTPSGWLGGISKRMSSLIFGPMTSESSVETRLVRVLTVQDSEDAWTVYVLAGHSLQKWRLSSHESDQLIFVAELSRLVKDSFHLTVWENCGGDQNETDTWLLDIQSDKGDIIVLAAAVNMHVSPQLHYAMISIQTDASQAPTTVKDFLLLKLTALYREDNPVDCLSYRFLLSGTHAYLYNHKSIVVVKPQEDPDTLEFNSSQDFILGGSICVGTPVFFSRHHGLIAVQSNDKLNFSASALPTTPLEVSLNESAAIANENLTIYNLDPEDIYSAYKDTVGQFKGAFIYHLKNQLPYCKEILDKLFVPETSTMYGVDAVLDKVVVKTLEDLLNDVPAGDPRWVSDTPVGIGSSYSMQVINQLVDKQKAANLFVKFLHDTDLWNRLLVCTVRDTPVATVHVVAELLEKVVAAIALKKLTVNNPCLEGAIEACIRSGGVEPKNGLSFQDVFYREVTKIYRALQELVVRCDDKAHSGQNPADTAALISDTNDVILQVLKEVADYREQNAFNFIPTPNALSLCPEYLPWTAAAGSEGLYDCLTTQQSLTYLYGIKASVENTLINTLYSQLVSIIDLLLDGCKCHLESVRGTEKESVRHKQYEIDRQKLLKPLLADKRWEQAAVLAEKYLDFETLVIVCESTNNQQRLDEYMERFHNEGFSEFVYNWYLQENKQGKLINQCRNTKKSRNAQKLSNFLSDHPALSWMQNIFESNYDVAAQTLSNLAMEETDSVTRQKTMLSLAKLSKLAANDSYNTEMFVQNVDAQLELVAFQEELPDYVLEQFGYDTRRPCVIPPKDLIKFYTCTEYKDATELEFKKALDLLSYVDNEELREELCLSVWRSAILRDSWNYGNVDSPLDILQHTLFFRLIDLALILDTDLQSVFPPLDALIDDPCMSGLKENNNFIFLLKAAYEYVQRTQSIF